MFRVNSIPLFIGGNLIQMSKIQDILDKQLDRADGAELSNSWCVIHGDNSLCLILRNQGGYDSTTACIKCLADLIYELIEQSVIDDRKIKENKYENK